MKKFLKPSKKVIKQFEMAGKADQLVDLLVEINRANGYYDCQYCGEKNGGGMFSLHTCDKKIVAWLQEKVAKGEFPQSYLDRYKEAHKEELE